MQHTYLQDIILLLLVSVPIVLLAIRIKVSPLVGFMITGIIVGPNGLQLIENYSRIELIAEIGVVLLLFSVGLEFSLKEMLKLKKTVLMGGSLQVSLTLLLATCIGFLLGWPDYQAVYFGAAIALSSTAVVFASLAHHQALHSPVGRAATGILVFQDFMVIPFLAFLPLVMMPAETLSTQGVAIFLSSLGKVVMILLISYILYKWVLHPLFHLVIRSKSEELLIVTTLGFAMGMSWLTHALGLSYALGAFLGGLLLSTTKHRDRALGKIMPFSHGFSALFFASIGMLFSVPFFLDHPWMILSLVVAIPLIKVIAAFVSIRVVKYDTKISLSAALLLGQIGEFSFLLGLQGHKLGVFSDFFYQLIVSFTVITLLITPLMASFILKGPLKAPPQKA